MSAFSAVCPRKARSIFSVCRLGYLGLRRANQRRRLSNHVPYSTNYSVWQRLWHVYSPSIKVTSSLEIPSLHPTPESSQKYIPVPEHTPYRVHQNPSIAHPQKNATTITCTRRPPTALPRPSGGKKENRSNQSGPEKDKPIHEELS